MEGPNIRSCVRLQEVRAMRRFCTPAEAVLWHCLRDRRFMDTKFRRQHRIAWYAVDFYAHAPKLVIEADGIGHSWTDEMIAYDLQRDELLRGLGLEVIRFTNDEVIHSPELVLGRIGDALILRM